jgi:hypothetical protein
MRTESQIATPMNRFTHLAIALVLGAVGLHLLINAKTLAQNSWRGTSGSVETNRIRALVNLSFLHIFSILLLGVSLLNLLDFTGSIRRG